MLCRLSEPADDACRMKKQKENQAFAEQHFAIRRAMLGLPLSLLASRSEALARPS